MGRVYHQLDRAERWRIARLRGEGCSARQIAAALDRAPSTIAAELKRNARSDGRYDPDYAEEQARARNWRGARLEREAELRERVLAMLAAGHSPQQVAGRLKREAGRTLISHESIYRFIYALIARTKDYRWRRLLPSGRSRRRPRGERGRRGGGGSVDYIEQRRTLAERPREADERLVCGHWEVDLMSFGRRRPLLLVLQERCSRALLAAALPSKAAEPLAAGLRGLFECLAPTLRRSATFDNGSEFVRHHRLHDLGIETFFCDPHSPWQKGGVENAIGRLRRALPRNTDLDALPPGALHAIIRDYNNTPRKCLDYQTPAEVLHAQLSRLQLEPTFLPAQE